jgi:hypothetical protein
MELFKVGPSETEVISRGKVLLFSYNTLVGVLHNGTGYITRENHSRTTQKHVSNWKERHDILSEVEVNQSLLDSLLNVEWMINANSLTQ